MNLHIGAYDGKEGTFIEDLKCSVHLIQYDPAGRFGTVLMLAGNCCSMDGAIRYFQRIDPNVETIMTYYTDNESDTSYHKFDGKWIAYPAKKLRPTRDGNLRLVR